MRRRDFIAGLSGVAAWPFASHAQQQPKLPTVGFLMPGTPVAYGQRLAATLQRLRELGWVEGRTVAFEYRWAEGQRFDEMAAELVRLKADVIFTSGTPPVMAIRKATPTVPIVFAAVGDPVGSGLVASLARPGGNITGVSNQTSDLASKRVGLLREAVPDLRRLAIMAKTVDNASAASEMRQVQAAANTLGMPAITLEIQRADEIAAAVESLKARAGALYIVIDSLMTTHAIRINTLALSAKLPTMHGARELVETGGLMSYGANFPDLWRQSANHIDKILRGAKPADIPVEQPIKFDFIINLTTAKALGITMPVSLLGRTDEMIE
jgi:putative ABC transport system substrate-binding protein